MDKQKKSTAKDYAKYVNPFIGTGGHGHTFPGAVLPNGMVQLSPDTRFIGWDASSGYHYTDSTIVGFSHTHLSGTGVGDYGDILFMPFTGSIQLKPGEVTPNQYSSSFQKGNESASPGYYSVFLDDYGVRAELTTTARAGFHRYTFPKNDSSGIIIDLATLIHPHRSRNLVNEIFVISDTEIAGLKQTTGWARNQYVYFTAKFNKPFTYTLFDDGVPLKDQKETSLVTKNGQVILHFSTAQNEEVLAKVGISPVDIDGARNNLLSEIDHWDFDLVKDNARKIWNEKLGIIDIEGGSSDQKTIFYTAMYHAFIHPSLHTDVDGRYRAINQEISVSEKNPIYTIFSLWDTYRALHPLLTILDPGFNVSLIESMLDIYKKGGILPMWELASNYTGTMIGYHAVSVIADAIMKGDYDSDIELAYEAMLRSSRYDTTGIFYPSATNQHHIMPQSIWFNLMPKSRYYNEKSGFIPSDGVSQSVSRALEYAYNDWCIAQVAEKLDKQDDYNYFMERAGRYKQYYDKQVGFMRGINKDGSWSTPFDPRYSAHIDGDFTEGNSYQWSWYVPHDIPGLIDLKGGEESFRIGLDSLFNTSSLITGDDASMDITGLIGQYAHGNEPSHHIIYLYNYTDHPWKTQELADSILNHLYFNDPNGLSGNEDCGQMSAWYILSSLGFYPVCPGNNEYAIGRPLFDTATINLSNGKTFTIKANNNNVKNKYIKNVYLNEQKLQSLFIRHEEIMAGGNLVFNMTDQPGSAF